MTVWFTSDLHIGHYNCAVKYRGFASQEEHDDIIADAWRVVAKRDKIFVVGDVGHNKSTKALEFYKDKPGFKHLIMGNHDQCSAQEYMKYFDKISGMVKYKDFWITHAPIIESELRGKKNLHGHLHAKHVMMDYENGILTGYIKDPSYINLNIDVNEYKFLSFEQIVAEHGGAE